MADCECPNVKPDPEALPSDDPKQRQPDISFAKEALEWEPQVALRDGLTKTIEYFDSHLKNGD